MEINPAVKIFIIIVIILFVLSGIPIKIIKDTLRQTNISTQNITPNVTPIIIYKTIEILVTPTPDGKIYFASEYDNGIRKLKRPFSILRENAQGLKTLSVHTTIYDYKIFPIYHWFNPNDYKYYPQYPINPDNKFIFIFINTYADDVIGDDARFWIPVEGSYLLESNNIVYSPISFSKQIRIKELESTYNYNDNSRVTAYNSNRIYKSSIEYSNTSGETSESIDVLKGGQSNAIDGYMIFEIPKDIKTEDITIWMNLYSWGNAGWVLKI
jgi:hypothetical protein